MWKKQLSWETGYMYACMHTNIHSLALPTERTLEQRCPVTMSMVRIQILASKYHSPLKRISVLGEIAACRAGTGEVQEEPTTFVAQTQKEVPKE